MVLRVIAFDDDVDELFGKWSYFAHFVVFVPIGVVFDVECDRQCGVWGQCFVESLAKDARCAGVEYKRAFATAYVNAGEDGELVALHGFAE